MSVAGGPDMIQDGLVLSLNAADRNSYPGSGATWFDLSGNGNNSTLTNGPTFNSANLGSIVFDGVDDYVIDSTTTNIPVGNSSRTICLWVYPSGTTNNFVQIGTGGGGNQVYIFQYFTITGTNFLYTDGVNGANNLAMTANQVPTLNTWNYLVFLNSGQTYRYYKNSILQLEGNWPVTLNTVGQKVLLGYRDDVASSTMNGRVGSLQIYNRALTATEITQNYNSTKTRFGL